MNTHKKNNLTNYNNRDLLLVFLLVATTGMEYFYRSQNYILIGCIISSFYFIKSRQKLDKSFLLVIILFIIVEVFQCLMFGGFNLRTFSGTYIRLFLSYSVVAIVRLNFFRNYVKLIYWFSLISIPFYIGSFIPGIESFYTQILGNIIPQIFERESYYQGRPNIIVFSFEETLFTDHRNSGPFWEPGAFGIFLCIALILNHIENRNIFTQKNIVFILCIISTLSTSAYIVLGIFFFYINYNKFRKNLLYTIVLALLVYSSLILYERIPFLKNKIENNIEIANETTTSRFGSALADFNMFLKSPIFGFGRAGAKTGFKSEKAFDVEDHRNNGVFNLMTTYGIIITVFYFNRILQTLKKIGINYNLPSYYYIFSFLVIIILGFSQGIFMRTFFYSFLFLPMIFENKILTKK